MLTRTLDITAADFLDGKEAERIGLILKAGLVAAGPVRVGLDGGCVPENFQHIVNAFDQMCAVAQ